MRFVFVFLVLLLSCRSGEPPAPPASPSAETPHQTQGSALEYVEIVRGEATAPLPIIVAVHGLGDTPEHFGGLFDAYPGPARIILPRAPTSYGQGFSWFSIDVDKLGGEEVAAGVAKAADRLAAFLKEISAAHPGSGKPVLTGFSQGGMLSFAVAVRHPEVIQEAIPLAGFLPAPLLPSEAPKDAVPIRAFHGAEDKLLPLSLARETVEALSGLGFTVELTEYPGVGHQLSAEMRRDLFALLEKAVGNAHHR